MKEVDYLIEFIEDQKYINELDKNPTLSFILHKSLNSNNFSYKSVSDFLISSILDDKADLNIRNQEIRDIIDNNAKKSSEKIDNNLYIKNIVVRNFRAVGEYSKEDEGLLIDFNNKYNIFFAPNGGGKTTICEALEYGITNNIKEAKKRKHKIDKYIKNVLSNGETSKLDPVLKITLTSGEDVKEFLSNNKNESLSLCFIEKNRIQEFVLLGSDDTSTSSSDILSDLTGIESLDHLYSSFIDYKSFKVDGLLKDEAKKEFQKKEEKIRDLKIGRYNIIRKLREYKRDSKSLLANLEISKDYLEQRLEYYNLLEEEIETLSFVDQDRDLIEKNLIYFKESYGKILEIRKYLTENTSDLQFLKLFTAIKQLSNNKDCDKTKCPACDTSIENVKNDPFCSADSNLDKFEAIDKKQSELSEIFKQYEKYKDILRREINCVLGNIVGIKPFFLSENFEEIENIIKKLDSEKKEMEEYNLILDILTHINSSNYFHKLSLCIKKNRKKLKIKNSIKKIQEKINRNIGDTNSKIKQVDALLNELKENTKEYKQIDFISVKQKIKEEEMINNLLKDLKSKYDDFYKKLTSFVRDKKKNNFDQIKSDVINFYNLINNHKKEDEEIKDLDLKLNEYQKGLIKIKCKNQNELVEATRILSEGHLRCLGLSLIFAAIKRNQNRLLPLIVFDDVINAIDIEHRDNILNLLFTNNFFKKKQLIITTHDRIFWEKFCNYYDSKIGNSKNISFILFHDKESGLYYESYDVGYHKKVEKSLYSYDIRQALIYLRLLFEKLVFEYCVNNNLKGEFKFNEKNGLYNKKGFIVSLESMYNICEKYLKNNESKEFINLFNKIKKTITFSFLNQEHHSFQNHGYELTHNKTTSELEDIYNSVKDFEKCVVGKKEYIKKLINILKAQIE